MSLIIIGLTYVGGATLAWLFAESLRAITQNLTAHIRPFFYPPTITLTTRFGPWAVVTGSTDGIGRAYADELAKRGLNIILISRTISKLEQTATEIEAKYLVKTKIIAADFSKGAEVMKMIESELGDLQIGILVNNVGKQYTFPMYLGEVPEQELWDIININVGATTAMTRMILPQMVERGKGAIVNVSSGSEVSPLPLMTVYAATKVFVKSFTEALRWEYKKQGITVQHLAPLFVNTKMNNFSNRLRQTSLFVPDAATYARHAVNTLGVLESSTGYWAHGLQYFFAALPPVWLRTYIGGLMNQAFREDYFRMTSKKFIEATCK